jgi:hypothetical protein
MERNRLVRVNERTGFFFGSTEFLTQSLALTTTPPALLAF